MDGIGSRILRVLAKSRMIAEAAQAGYMEKLKMLPGVVVSLARRLLALQDRNHASMQRGVGAQRVSRGICPTTSLDTRQRP